MNVLKNLKPEKVFEYFEKISSIPHGSFNTKKISDYLVSFAKEYNLKYIQDEYNNVIIFKNGSISYENCEPLILQGHIDMVCAKKPLSNINMEEDPIILQYDDTFVFAKDTSLGGDDGIAVAMILAILSDEDILHPPLEAIFTVDEEVGMLGASKIDLSKIKGRKLINLDSEIEGVFTVSCAGGERVDCKINSLVSSPINSKSKLYSISINNLLGGHSGIDITKGRINANILMGRVLSNILLEFPSIRLSSIQGGEFDNVISSNCECKFFIENDNKKIKDLILSIEKMMKNEYEESDPNVSISIKEIEDSKNVAFSNESTKKIITLLSLLPQGVFEMSQTFNIPKTSMNLGIVSLKNNSFQFTYSLRSTFQSQKDLLYNKLKQLITLFDGEIKIRSPYPAWEYNKNSSFRKLIIDVYKELYDKEAKIEATHGGLECGIFISKISNLDCISFGPNVLNVHSINEKLDIKSVERTYNLLINLLKRCK
ncbi:MAG: aminoacyl-histidine dipeptidase [Eubacteriales bacterium]|nr:aminoacyl-histidine dipeptidase [Eubacteriales bacterium]